MFDSYRFVLLSSTLFGISFAQNYGEAPKLIDKCKAYGQNGDCLETCRDGDALLVSESPKTWSCGPKVKDCYLYSNDLKCIKCEVGELLKTKSGSMKCGPFINKCQLYSDTDNTCEECAEKTINFWDSCLEFKQADYKKPSYDYGRCYSYRRTLDNFAECALPQYCEKRINNRCACSHDFVGIGTEVPECIEEKECNAKDNSVVVTVPDAGKQCFRNDEDGIIATLTLDGKELSILKEDSEIKSEIQLVVASDKTIPIRFKVNADKSISFKDDKYNRFIQVNSDLLIGTAENHRVYIEPVRSTGDTFEVMFKSGPKKDGGVCLDFKNQYAVLISGSGDKCKPIRLKFEYKK
ncbi:hypothetical protein O9G_004596 [Rozella allomycis CSF55]|uniref:Uncharacterized protein n=1 Tax=Rozella allomycis (strain CSF55) TaxID=988480 RepID=A0A075B374_ROZAC|nr:hypothetical protein O9G_004596 [Rozella allomycis CSF55]|eukprot:EPZ36804.1 hypothetical protein O9G_004596 [Rozella allomycis CSF55]